MEKIDQVIQKDRIALGLKVKPNNEQVRILLYSMVTFADDILATLKVDEMKTALDTEKWHCGYSIV